MPPIAGENGCGIAAPVKLTAIALDGNRTVLLDPAVTIRCSFASALSDWIRQDLAPLLAPHHGGLTRLSGMGGYECRGRNRVVGGKLSEHASGNAVDIQAFVLADGTTAKITDVAKDDTLFAQVKLTTCARFSTVLGPGSDGFHEDNLHLDMAPRRNGKHFCRWQLP